MEFGGARRDGCFRELGRKKKTARSPIQKKQRNASQRRRPLFRGRILRPLTVERYAGSWLDLRWMQLRLRFITWDQVLRTECFFWRLRFWVKPESACNLRQLELATFPAKQSPTPGILCPTLAQNRQVSVISLPSPRIADPRPIFREGSTGQAQPASTHLAWDEKPRMSQRGSGCKSLPVPSLWCCCCSRSGRMEGELGPEEH